MKQPSRRQFVQTITAAALSRAGFGRSQRESGKSRPNIIVFLTDDQRWDALGCMGNPIVQTPAVDQLAREGCLFENGFVTTSLCGPSRVSILTGLYARCHGIHGFEKGLTGKALESSYPLSLRSAGYRTGFIGKWGAAGGGVASRDYSLLPTDSFDFFEGFPGQGKFFPDPENPKRHLTRIMGDHAIEFLKGCSNSQPFCHSISFKAPHVQSLGEWPYDPAYEELYKDIEIPKPEHSEKKYFEALPTFLKEDYAGRVRWEKYMEDMKFEEIAKKYYRLITGIDVQVGRVVEELSARNLDQNTIIIFTSDNGYLLGDRGLIDKYVMYEESIRVPLIIRDPRNPEARGVVREEMALNIDIAPTILDLAGVDIPSWMNGRSLRPLLGHSKVSWRDEWFYEHLFEWGPPGAFPKMEGIRTTRWKYIRWIDQTPVYEQLFDLLNDPGELNSLVESGGHRKQLQALRAICNIWVRSLEKWNRSEAWHEPVPSYLKDAL